MLKNTYSDSLGLGGQSIGDFLQGSDTNTLRSKYYDTVEAGLGAAGEPAELDDTKMLISGVLPTLAMALLTKGKALGFAGPAIGNVVESERKRAENAQKMSVEAKLKGAGLFGEELSRRETQAVDTANKIADREAKAEQAKQTSEDRRYAADLQASTSRDNAALMASVKRDGQSAGDDKTGFSQAGAVADDYDRAMAPIRAKASAVKQVFALTEGALKNPDTSKTVEATLLGQAVTSAQGAKGVSDKDIAMYKGTSIGSYLTAVKNFANGGGAGEMPKGNLESMKVLAGILSMKIAEEAQDTDRRFRTRAEMINNPQFREKTNKYFDDANPFPKLKPESKFQTKAGVMTLQQLRSSVAGWDDSMVNKLTPVE